MVAPPLDHNVKKAASIAPPVGPMIGHLSHPSVVIWIRENNKNSFLIPSQIIGQFPFSGSLTCFTYQDKFLYEQIQESGTLDVIITVVPSER